MKTVGKRKKHNFFVRIQNQYNTPLEIIYTAAAEKEYLQMPGILLNITTEKLFPMVEATTTAIPITKTTTTIITNLSNNSHGQSKRPTIIIYPTGKITGHRKAH